VKVPGTVWYTTFAQQAPALAPADVSALSIIAPCMSQNVWCGGDDSHLLCMLIPENQGKLCPTPYTHRYITWTERTHVLCPKPSSVHHAR
jgi:hypothetical protein